MTLSKYYVTVLLMNGEKSYITINAINSDKAGYLACRNTPKSVYPLKIEIIKEQVKERSRVS